MHWPLSTVLQSVPLQYSARAETPKKLDCTTFLPVLSGIMPPDIRLEGFVAKLVTAAKENPHHPQHHQVSIAAATFSPKQLKSRRPFIRNSASKLADSFNPMLEWNNKISHGPSLLISAYQPPSSTLPPGADLPRNIECSSGSTDSDLRQVTGTIESGYAPPASTSHRV